MKIAIDATLLRKENTGTGFYIINLVNGLLETSDDKDSFYIIVDKELAGIFFDFKGRKNFYILDKKFKNRIQRVLWQFFVLPFELKKKNINILHSPNYVTPLIKLGLKIVVTIHDLTFFIFPEKFTITKRLFFKFFIPMFIKKADKVIAVSENTRKDILRYFKIKKENVTVTYESIPKYYNCDIQPEKNLLSKYGIDKEYMLFVGMIEPRKNILSILKAYKKIEKEINADLVIVGKKGWYFKEIEQYFENIKSEGLKNKIIFTGYVAEPELKYFYKNALIFIYPSIYEGFGLPPLQSMACGVPVITSDTSSLPEVVADSAIKIDPENEDRLADEIKKLYFNPLKRKEMSEKGIRQAEKFSLKNFAIKTLEVYKTMQSSI